MTFRTPAEAVALANNTRYGLAASVWTENINLALDIARKIKAGVGLDQRTNLFDAASGFGGYRESGFGREGGREGMFEYLHADARRRPQARDAARPRRARPRPPLVDRTAKLFIGGKQARPDRATACQVLGPDGQPRRRGRRGQPQGHPQRRRGRARRRGRLGVRHRAQARADPLLRRREPLGARRRVRGPHRADDGPRRRARRSRPRSRGSSPTPPGPTSTTAPCTECRCAA